MCGEVQLDPRPHLRPDLPGSFDGGPTGTDEPAQFVQVGLPCCVIQGDADTDLDDYPDGAFDYAVLSQTLQATRHPRRVVENLVRIGRHAILSLPNFGHWKVRLGLLAFGRMPQTDALPFHWYDTPNIHLCTIRDFLELCEEIEVDVEKAIVLDTRGRTLPMQATGLTGNLMGITAVFLLRKS